ncbi:MAG: TolC family protein [Treponema sp.]|nr:TolC family protein [Treponema sp.]
MKKSLKKAASLFFIGCVATVFSFAQTASAEGEAEPAKTDVVKLTLDDAIKYALDNSRTLKSNDIDLEIKARASKYSWNVFLPTVQATGTMSRATEYSPSNYALYNNVLSPILNLPQASTDFADEEAHWSVVGGVSVGLNLSLAYIQQIRAAKADYELGKISWEQSNNETIVNIKKLFYGLLVQQENLKIQETTLENARQRYNQASTNFRNGAIPRIQMLQAQVNYENTKPDVEDAERAVAQQLDTFAFLIGLPVGTNLELEGSIEPVYIEANADDLLAKYKDESLDIRTMKKTIEKMKMQLSALNLSSYTPALSLNYAWQPAYLGDAFSFMGDIGKDDMWYDSGAFSVTLAWNLTNMLPFSSNRQSAADLRANIAKLELTMETLEENQKIQVRTAVDTLNAAKEQIDSMGRTVEVAQEAYDMSARSYRNGTMELLDLRDAESSLNQAKLGLLSKKMSYITALMDLETTLHTTLTK